MSGLAAPVYDESPCIFGVGYVDAPLGVFALNPGRKTLLNYPVRSGLPHDSNFALATANANVSSFTVPTPGSLTATRGSSPFVQFRRRILKNAAFHRPGQETNRALCPLGGPKYVDTPLP